MKGNIIFIGGIHGVGKGTLCKNVASELNITHITASEVLKWDEFTSDSANKYVTDIQATQERLLCNLEKIVQPEQTYLLDGHFCLFNNEGKIDKVPDKTFIRINPVKLVLITENPEVICSRLFQRDGIEYNIRLLEQMQEFEKAHALYIYNLLNIEIFEMQSEAYATLKEIVNCQRTKSYNN